MYRIVKTAIAISLLFYYLIAHANQPFVVLPDYGYDPGQQYSYVATGNEYYIDNTPGAGDDSSPGTFNQPWETIGKANQILQAGDIVYFRAGEYDGIIEPFNSGLEGQPIIYTTYNNEQVLIKGEPGKTFGVVSIGWKVYGNWDPKSYIIVDGFTLRYEYAVSGTSHINVFITGFQSHHNTVRNCKIYRPGDPAIGYRSGFRETGVTIQRSDFNLIENNIVEGMYKNGIGISKSAKFNTIRRNNIVNNVHNQITFASTCGSADPVPCEGEIQGNLIESNLIGGSQTSDGVQTNPNFLLSGDEFKNDVSTRGIIIRNNVMFNNAENAIDIKGTSNIVIEGNILYESIGDNDGFGVRVTPTGNTHEKFGPAAITHGSGATSRDVIIRNNIVYDNAGGIRLQNGWMIYNNTIISNDRAWDAVHSTPDLFNRPGFVGIQGWGSDHVVKNNILGDHPIGEYSYQASNATTLDYNLYFNTYKLVELINFVSDNNWTPILFTDWQTLLQSKINYTGKDENSFIADPKFINVPSRPVGDISQFDFRLRGDSQAIDSGDFLTRTVGSGANSNIVVVLDSRYFYDGYGVTEGDSILIGNNKPIRITAIDYTTHGLTLASAITWNNNDPVSLPYNGNRPDIGAFEFGPDADSDGIRDLLDNCPLDANPLQEDNENDGFGDVCDMDDDNDGLPDTIEDVNSNGIVDAGETNPLNADTDGDGFNDGQEVGFGSNPLDSANTPANGDLNEDGQVNAGDVVLVNRIVLGLLAPTTNQRVRADVAPLVTGLPSPDGVINTADVLVITRKALGIVNF